MNISSIYVQAYTISSTNNITGPAVSLTAHTESYSTISLLYYALAPLTTLVGQESVSLCQVSLLLETDSSP